ncbi:hypothetical protein AtNW77_Chr2g0245371 [Arabidopsis thaliana]
MGAFGFFEKQIEAHVELGVFLVFDVLTYFSALFFFFVKSEMVEDKGGKWNMLLECHIHYNFVWFISIFIFLDF